MLLLDAMLGDSYSPDRNALFMEKSDPPSPQATEEEFQALLDAIYGDDDDLPRVRLCEIEDSPEEQLRQATVDTIEEELMKEQTSDANPIDSD